MKIEIKKSEIFAEVEKQSAYVASTVEGGIHFDELWATSHDYAIMDSYWVEGCASAVSILMRYIRSESVEHNLEEHSNADVFFFRTDMPDTFNDFLIGSIVSSLKMMLVNSILAAWLAMKYPNVSERYANLANDYSEDVKSKLLYRNQPFQNRSKHEGEDTANDAVTEQFSRGQTDTKEGPVTAYYAPTASDKEDEEVVEQYSKASLDTIEKPFKEVFGSPAADENYTEITEQFSKGQADTNEGPITAYYAPTASDKEDEEVVEQYSKAAKDTNVESVTEYFEKKEPDNLKFKQYEKCCYHP